MKTPQYSRVYASLIFSDSEATPNTTYHNLSKHTTSNSIRVKQAKPELAIFMDFITVTGLRFNEAIYSYNLIIKLAKEGKLGEYYNAEKEVLEHFRFKDLFIRRTKKAFMSFISESFIETISREQPLTSSRVQSIRKHGFKLRFSDIREAHGTFLTKHLRESEIDFLHGRVSANVFMKNYFNPALIGDLRERTLRGARELLTNIS